MQGLDQGAGGVCVGGRYGRGGGKYGRGGAEAVWLG